MNAIHKPIERMRARQQGMTLAELLVTLTVFTVAAAVALILYNALARSYKLGDNATDVQQNTRVAFENLVTDLRMMGFNYNPDGATRPDEQLEGAWDTAITLRGDFDFENATASTTPEVALASGSSPYNVVSVGNDEIVTYVLAKPGATSGATLTFVADVAGPVRDGVAENVSIPNVALVQNNPPYTLYRVTVAPGSTNVNRVPVADNIYSMEFLYYDSNGAVVNPATPADASDDIGGGDTTNAKAIRESVRRVEIRLTGMTPDPDLRYTDPDDPYTPTQKHRKFTLVQDVTPRNAGYVGRPDIDRLPPTQPQNVTACPGQCQSALIQWNPAPVNDVVALWTVLTGTSTTVLTNPKTFSSSPALVTGLTEGTPYYFRVRAEDSAGNVSPPSNFATPAPATIGDITTPSAVGNLVVTGNSAAGTSSEAEHIRLGWSEVTTNVETVTCDPQPTRIRDLKGYRLYRSTSATGVASPANLYKDATALPAGTLTFVDSNVVACRTYYYDITAIDKCGHESASLPNPKDGISSTAFVPQKPGGLQATPAGPDTNALSWSRVSNNTNTPPDSILVDTYRIYRTTASSGIPSASASTLTFAPLTDVKVADVTAPAFLDTTATDPGAGLSYYYRVSGLSDCASPYDEGVPSDPVEAASCNFNGFIVLNPAEGTVVSASTTISVYVSGADQFAGHVTVTDSSGAVVASFGDGANPQTSPFSFTWDTIALPPGDYTILATMTNNTTGCTDTASATVTVTMPAACCVQPLSPVLGPAAGKLSSRYSDVLFSLVNNCATDLLISREGISWTNITGTGTQLEDVCWDVPPTTAPENCTPVLTFSPPANSPANPTHSPELLFPATRDDLYPLIVGYKFTTALITGTTTDDLGETITVNMFYRTVGSTSDSTCIFQIQTNPLSVTTVQP